MQLRQLPAKVVLRSRAGVFWHGTVVLLLFQLLWINSRDREQRCPPPKGKNPGAGTLRQCWQLGLEG